MNPKILFVSSEVTPFAKTGGLADVSGALPKALKELGCDVRIVLPLYKSVTEGNFNLKKIKSNVYHRLLGNLPPFNIYESHDSGVATYFIDHREYFDRDELYGDAQGDYPDNAYRFSFFSKACLALLKALNFRADIVHCNDWQSALIPFYLNFKLKNSDRFFNEVKTVYSIHNLAYQGQFPKQVISDIDIPEKYFNMYDLEFYGKINFMKSGILYSDAVGTVSKGYAREILTVEYGCGLEGVLNTRKESLFGITNGVDYTEWNPQSDEFIIQKYGEGGVHGKRKCKEDLLDTLKMKLPPDRPLLGMITRLAAQKGVDLLVDIMDKLVELNVGLVILGKGDEEFQRLFLELSSKYPDNISVNIKFDNMLAHKIEAGADIFLMPSRYEPCGLNQMYSLKYGTIPVVRATGGLDDIIADVSNDADNGNGFKFNKSDSTEFFDSIDKAINMFNKTNQWNELIARVMKLDYSWAASAKAYLNLYTKLGQKNG